MVGCPLPKLRLDPTRDRAEILLHAAASRPQLGKYPKSQPPVCTVRPIPPLGLDLRVRLTPRSTMLAMLAKAKLTMGFNAHVIRDREKALVFCQLPATTIITIAALRLIGVGVVILGALMKPEERKAVITAFT